MSWFWASDETGKAIMKYLYRREHLIIGPRTQGMKIKVIGFFDNIN